MVVSGSVTIVPLMANVAVYLLRGESNGTTKKHVLEIIVEMERVRRDMAEEEWSADRAAQAI